ncbi:MULTISPECIES: CheR family methyltransferase [Gottfriedia]|uniref:protein-glutamate O-methyltransferase n=1 Tax=Gottfriedia solisilvae TaxID=1516104 RepID=A0A8J3AK98_9BACI|nr:protein-glutamate O-methyltransferase CheR [Gottfriedia solisilvae]GGI12251.1 chemotaxis protein methyltransferase [Gottfriedia solisilvae]
MDDYIDFINLVKKKSGIDLYLYKESQMKRRLKSLYEKKGFRSFVDFFKGMEKDKELYYEFLDRMTINVSEFFRNPNRWDVFEKNILPPLLKNNSKLKIWSAACSTGEEPYTLAMILLKYLKPSQFQIIATDLDENVLSKAKIGVYNEKAIKDVPKDLLAKYFKHEGTIYQVSDELKKQIQFKKHNLLLDAYEKNVDVIVCRNVLIYFTEEAKVDIYTNFSNSLNQNGILFVGSTEQIFHAEKYSFTSNETFFYKKS